MSEFRSSNGVLGFEVDSDQQWCVLGTLWYFWHYIIPLYFYSRCLIHGTYNLKLVYFEIMLLFLVKICLSLSVFSFTPQLEKVCISRDNYYALNIIICTHMGDYYGVWGFSLGLPWDFPLVSPSYSALNTPWIGPAGRLCQHNFEQNRCFWVSRIKKYWSWI